MRKPWSGIIRLITFANSGCFDSLNGVEQGHEPDRPRPRRSERLTCGIQGGSGRDHVIQKENPFDPVGPMQGRMASIQSMGSMDALLPGQPGQRTAGFRANEGIHEFHSRDLGPAPCQCSALVEPALSLSPVVKRDGHDGPSVGPDIQWTPFQRHGPAEVDPDTGPHPVFQAVDEPGFEHVGSIAEPGPSVRPILGVVEPAAGVGWTSSPGEGARATPLSLFPGEHAVAGSATARYRRRFKGPGCCEGEVADRDRAGAMRHGSKVGLSGCPSACTMCLSRFSLFP